MKTLISVEVELSDENGNVKYLRENPQRFANETLMERETLVLLQVNREYNKHERYSYTKLYIIPVSFKINIRYRLR